MQTIQDFQLMIGELYVEKRLLAGELQTHKEVVEAQQIEIMAMHTKVEELKEKLDEKGRAERDDE